VPLSGSHAAAVAAALDILRPESALIFVCPNAGESVAGRQKRRRMKHAVGENGGSRWMKMLVLDVFHMYENRET